MAFCANTKSKACLEELKIRNFTSAVKNCIYFLVVLSEEEAKLVRQHQTGRAADEPLNRRAELALEYGIKTFPRIIVCDWYGNALGRTKISELEKKADALIKKMLKKQADLEKKLTRQFESIKKNYQKEAEQGEFTAATIARLNEISGYRGYTPSVRAGEYLEEINRAAERELAELCAADDGSDAASFIRVLKKFQSKYKNLPAGQAAEEKIKELKSES